MTCPNCGHEPDEPRPTDLTMEDAVKVSLIIAAGAGLIAWGLSNLAIGLGVAILAFVGMVVLMMWGHDRAVRKWEERMASKREAARFGKARVIN